MASSDVGSLRRNSSQSSSISRSKNQSPADTSKPNPSAISSRHASNVSLRQQQHARPSTPSATLSDDQSLTSFPSLSPSLEASPSSPQHGTNPETRTPTVKSYRQDHDEVAQTKRKSDPGKNTRPEPASLHSLFTMDSAAGERSTLFEDAQRSEPRVPGALHLQTESQIEHLMKSVGPVTLVKQLAQDLAERDVQVTQIQRRAEERERLLRKMLRECEVSNLDIEKRLRELKKGSAGSGARNRAESTASQWSELDTKPEDAIDERVEQALQDTLEFGELEDDDDPESSTNQVKRRSGDHDDGVLVNSKTLGSTNKVGTSRGWRDYFRAGPTGERQSAPVRTSKKSPATVVKRDGASTGTTRQSQVRKGLSSDLFRPPPRSPPISRKSSTGDTKVSAASVQSESGTGESGKAGTSVASWALKMVAGQFQGSDVSEDDSTTKRTSGMNSSDDTQETPKRRPFPRVKSGAEVSTSKTSASVHPPGMRSSAANGFVKKGSPDIARTSATNQASNHSPRGSISSGTNLNHGPVEMDTILPDDSRPPTLAPHDVAGENTDLLTDRFGFIYDQRRRKWQSEAASKLQRQNRGSRVETLENHRLSVASFQSGDDDAISISSQSSAPLATSPHDTTLYGHAGQSKRWQDYLKSSSMSSELLSHTPQVKSVSTDAVTINTEDIDQNPKIQLSISKQGTIPQVSSNPAPTPLKITSDNAELAMPKASGHPSPVADAEPKPDPVKSLLDQMTDVHDSLQKDKSNKWNEFLRKVRAERERERERDTDHNKNTSGPLVSHDRRHKSISLPEANILEGEMIGVAGLGNKGKVGRAKWIEFRQLVLGGIPVAYRAKIWSECSGASSMRVPGYYEDLVRSNKNDASGADPTIVQQIQADITRTLTDNIFFRRGTGVAKLQEVLLAYARRNPAIGYCQGMNLITANLLLIFPTTEDAFWLLTCLVENILPDGYYDHSLLASRADQVVLKHYVTNLLPALADHLESLNVELEAATFQWFLSLFTACLSAEALFRVWDVLLCANDGSTGGSTFLFQVALALLKLNEKELLKCGSPAEVYAYMGGRMTNHAISIDGLLKASEGLKKWIRRDEVEKRRGEQVEREREVERAREAIRHAHSRKSSKIDERSGSPIQREGKHAGEVVEAHDETGRDDENELQIRTPMPVEDNVAWSK